MFPHPHRTRCSADFQLRAAARAHHKESAHSHLVCSPCRAPRRRYTCAAFDLKPPQPRRRFAQSRHRWLPSARIELWQIWSFWCTKEDSNLCSHRAAVVPLNCTRIPCRSVTSKHQSLSKPKIIVAGSGNPSNHSFKRCVSSDRLQAAAGTWPSNGSTVSRTKSLQSSRR